MTDTLLNPEQRKAIESEVLCVLRRRPELSELDGLRIDQRVQEYVVKKRTQMFQVLGSLAVLNTIAVSLVIWAVKDSGALAAKSAIAEAREAEAQRLQRWLGYVQDEAQATQHLAQAAAGAANVATAEAKTAADKAKVMLASATDLDAKLKKIVETTKANASEIAKAVLNDPDAKAMVADSLKVGAPVGSVIAWPCEGLPPDGWLPCDGRELSKADYPEITKKLGTTYGDVSGGCKLPNFQGYFLRGLGGINAEGKLGRPQSDGVGAHVHSSGDLHALIVFGGQQLRMRSASPVPSWDEEVVVDANNQRHPSDSPSSKATAIRGDTGNVTARPGAETRPTNYAVMWLIRVR